MKQNRLDLKQKISLVEWLRANLDSLSQEKASYTAAAGRATKALGFPVTDKACDSTCRQVGIQWDHALPNSARSYALQLASLESRIAALEKALL